MPTHLVTKKYLTRFAFSVIVFCLVATIGIFGYVQIFSYKFRTDDDGFYFLINNKTGVVVTDVNLIIIGSKASDYINTPIYFIPGGLVEPESYLPFLIRISQKRKSVIYIQKPLLNLAITNIGRSIELIKEYGINKTIIAGHSLGGVVACRNISFNPDLFSGLVLFGSYCDQSIANFGGKVDVIYGQNDEILGRDNFDKNKSNLPKQAKIEEVQGLNHSGLFDYGVQNGDGEMAVNKLQLVERLAKEL